MTELQNKVDDGRMVEKLGLKEERLITLSFPRKNSLEVVFAGISNENGETRGHFLHRKHGDIYVIFETTLPLKILIKEENDYYYVDVKARKDEVSREDVEVGKDKVSRKEILSCDEEEYNERNAKLRMVGI